MSPALIWQERDVGFAPDRELLGGIGFCGTVSSSWRLTVPSSTASSTEFGRGSALPSFCAGAATEGRGAFAVGGRVTAGGAGADFRAVGCGAK